MKFFNDYTTQELDELYANLSEVAQDFVYGGVIAEEVSLVCKETGLHLDKWQLLETLVLETLLGIVPSSMFAGELARRVQTTPEIINTLVAHMDSEIFSVIRDESVADYADTNEKNVSQNTDNAIYDEAQDDIVNSINNKNPASVDPYRENSDISTEGVRGRGPVITEEKLHIVDELFAPYTPKIKELTPADGSVRVLTEDAPHAGGLFHRIADGLKDKPKEVISSVNTPTSSFVITREMLEAEEMASKSGGAGGAFVGMEKMTDILKSLPDISDTDTKKTESTIKKDKKTIKLHVEKSTNGGIKIHIEKINPEEVKNPVGLPVQSINENLNTPTAIIKPIQIPSNTSVDIVSKIKPSDDGHPADSLPHVPNPHYTVDPYKEIL